MNTLRNTEPTPAPARNNQAAHKADMSSLLISRQRLLTSIGHRRVHPSHPAPGTRVGRDHLTAYIARVVALAPPLTAEQMSTLGAVFRSQPSL